MNNAEKLEQWKSAEGTRNPVIEVFRSFGYDPYDPWGSTIEAQFQICFTLLRGGADIPAAWQFSPGAFTPAADDNDPDKEDAENSDGSLLGWEFDLILREGGYRNLIHAGTILERYAALLKSEGRDY